METVELTEAQAKSRRGRNIAHCIVLAVLVGSVYVVTIIKFGSGAIG